MALDGDPPTYPVTVTFQVPGRVQLAAYGAAGYVWLAPLLWTGSGAVGADGSEFIQLFPAGGSREAGPRIESGAETGCFGCKVPDAAPYFREAMRAYNREENLDRK